MAMRRPTRLPSYDYSLPGIYFVTICTYQRKKLFGSINNYKMCCNHYGEIAKAKWARLPSVFPHVSLDAFIVMPNHIHGLIRIQDKRDTLSYIIKHYKYQTTKDINGLRGSKELVWQRSFYDKILRREDDLMHLRRYIEGNPAKWAEDEYNRD